MFPAGIYYVQTRGCASSVRDIGGKSMIIAVQRCSGEVKQTHFHKLTFFLYQFYTITMKRPLGHLRNMDVYL